MLEEDAREGCIVASKLQRTGKNLLWTNANGNFKVKTMFNHHSENPRVLKNDTKIHCDNVLYMQQ